LAGIYVPSGWKHYAMPGAEKLRSKPALFPVEKKMGFFPPKGEKTVFPRETNILLRVFLCQA
jgi:hypothetical protein